MSNNNYWWIVKAVEVFSSAQAGHAEQTVYLDLTTVDRVFLDFSIQIGSLWRWNF